MEPEVEPVAYEKITTMVMPDLSKITGKPTIDWDEFNKEKELRAERESIALNEAEPEPEAGADEADDSANVVPFSFVPKSLKDALSNSQKAPSNNANSPKDLTLEQQMQIRLGLLDMLQNALDKHKKSQGFTVVDDNNDDSLSDDANSQDQSPIVHRHVTFATLNEEELSDDSNLALQDQADVQDSSLESNSESTLEGNQDSCSDDKQEAEVSLQVNKDSGEDSPINQADATSNSSADSGSKSASGAAMNEPETEHEAEAESRAEPEPKSGTEPETETESVSEPEDETEDDEEILTIIPASEYISDPHKEENLNIPRDFSSMQSFLMGLNTSYNQPKEATFMFQDMNGSQEQLKTAKDDSKDNQK